MVYGTKAENADRVGVGKQSEPWEVVNLGFKGVARSISPYKL
jgi:hypothetical protein